MKVSFDTIEKDGLVLVLHTAEDIDRMVKQLDEEAVDAKNTADREAFEAVAKRLRSERAKVESAGVAISRRSFDVKPYTTLDRMEAVDRATSYQGGSPSVNNARKWLILVSRSTGMSEEEVGNLPPALFDALATRVMQISEPDPAQISFFVSALLSSEKEES